MISSITKVPSLAGMSAWLPLVCSVAVASQSMLLLFPVGPAVQFCCCVGYCNSWWLDASHIG